MKRITRVFVCLIALALVFSGSAQAYPRFSQSILSAGDYGADVEVLQNELLALGFYNSEISGIFDSVTKESVLLLQRELDVKQDGVFGPKTLSSYIAALDDGALVPDYNRKSDDSVKLLSGLVIGIDPGHQLYEDIVLEPLAPGSDRTKARMSAGAIGVKTGIPEYRITLQIAQKLCALLETAGTRVVMTRTCDDVNISNMERAQIMNDAEVNMWIRLHCDSSSSERTAGARVLVPSRSSCPEIYNASLSIGKLVLKNFCNVTGARKLNVIALGTQTGFNWSDSPVIAIEMGYLSNAQNDVKLNRDSYQNACALGIYTGISAYYASHPIK